MSDQLEHPQALEPVDQPTITRLQAMSQKKQELALQLLEIEQEKVRILVAAEMLSKQIQTLFDQVATARGIDTGANFNIDSETGVITIAQ